MPPSGRTASQKDKLEKLVKKHLDAYRRDYLRDNAGSLSKQYNDYRNLPLILYLDCAPVHTSDALRTEMRKRFPNLWVTFIPARSTGYLQPLDIAFFGPFKAALKHAYITALCGVLVNNGAIVPSGGKATQHARVKLVMSVNEWLVRFEGPTGDKLRTAIRAAFASSGLTNICDKKYEHDSRAAALAASTLHTLTDKAEATHEVRIYDIFRVPELLPQVIVDARLALKLAAPIDLFRGSWGALPQDLKDLFADMSVDLAAIEASPNARADAVEGYDTDSCSDSEGALADDEDGGAVAAVVDPTLDVPFFAQAVQAEVQASRYRPPPPPAPAAGSGGAGLLPDP